MSKPFIILIALIAGVFCGIAIGTQANIIVDICDVIGTLWLNGMRMTVVPLVVALLITGIVQTAEAAKAGRLAGRAVGTMLVILWCSSIMAAVVLPILLTAFPMPPGSGDALRAALVGVEKPAAVPPFGDFLRAMVPTNPIAAAASDALLPLLIFTAALGFAIARLPRETRSPLAAVFSSLADALVIVINWVLALAPLGVFALALVVGAKAGATAFGALAHYILILSSLGVVVWVASLAVAVIGGKTKLAKFFQAAIPAQAVAISTQSSLASLPAMIKGVRSLGVAEESSDMILPLAVSIFRATGPAMNLGVALYIAHWFGIVLGPAQIAVGIAAGAITTMGAVSLPGSVSFVSSIAPICLAIGAPVEPLALLIAVETFPDIFRTLGNVTMDMAVTAMVGNRHRDEG